MNNPAQVLLSAFEREKQSVLILLAAVEETKGNLKIAFNKGECSLSGEDFFKFGSWIEDFTMHIQRAQNSLEELNVAMESGKIDVAESHSELELSRKRAKQFIKMFGPYLLCMHVNERSEPPPSGSSGD